MGPHFADMKEKFQPPDSTVGYNLRRPGTVYLARISEGYDARLPAYLRASRGGSSATIGRCNHLERLPLLGIMEAQLRLPQETILHHSYIIFMRLRETLN